MPDPLVSFCPRVSAATGLSVACVTVTRAGPRNSRV